jgi:hypothetical protein
MSSHPFDALVFRLPTELRRSPVAVNQKRLVVHHAGTEVLVDKIPLFKADKYNCFRVTLDATVACPEAKTTLTQHHRTRGIVYFLTITGFAYTAEEVTAGSGNRERLVQFGRMLATKPIPFDAVTAQINQWLQEHIIRRVAEQAAPLVDFSVGERKLAGDRIKNLALEKWGLQLDCQIRVPEEDVAQLQTNLLIPVLVNDSNEDLEARVELVLERPRDPAEFQRALEKAQSREEIEERIKAITVQWFRDECTLEEFCFPEYQSEVRKRLQEKLELYINQELGRRIFTLRVTCLCKFPIDFPGQLQHVVTCKVEPGQTNIPIMHQLLLQRKNIAAFRARKIESLETYVKNVLETQTRAVLFGVNYVSVITNFDNLCDLIKVGVKTEIDKIGFQVTQLISKADDPEIGQIIGRAFSFDTGQPEATTAARDGGAANGGDPKIFGTKDPRVNFGLSVQARVRLRDFTRVRDLIKPGHDLTIDFKRVSRDAAAEVIRRLTPQELYTAFTVPLQKQAPLENQEDSDGDRSSLNLRESPESNICANVKERLETYFLAVVESVSVRREVTELTQIAAALQPAGDYPHVFQDTMLGSGGEKITFRLNIRVVNVSPDGFEKFQHHCSSTVGNTPAEKAGRIVSAIKAMLESAARTNLRSLPPEYVRLPVRDALIAAEKYLFADEIVNICKSLGLIIQVKNFRPDVTEREKREITNENDRRITIEGRLENARGKLLSLPFDDDAVKDLKKEIKDLENELKAFATTHDKNFDDAKGKSAQFKAPSLTDFLALAKESPSTGQPQKLEDRRDNTDKSTGSDRDTNKPDGDLQPVTE